ncbi:MAG: cation transporter [Candidatus Nezhaarchaeales archaeon]
MREAVGGFKISLSLSLSGTVIEGMVLTFFAYNIVLLADFAHWLIDTILEALFVTSLSYASKSYRRFPLGIIMLESILVTLVALVMIGVYGYFFVNYFASYTPQELSGEYHPALALVTVLGGVFTAIAMKIQKKRYERLGLKAIKIDYLHAVIDTFAAAVATTGMLTISYTGNPGYEALFTALLTLFVFHGIVEVLRDTFKTIIGRNVEVELRLKIFEKLVRCLERVHVKFVDARRIGSFYIVSIHVEVNPKTTIEEAYKLRNQMIDLIREESDLIYHIDVYMSPRRRFKKKYK